MPRVNAVHAARMLAHAGAAYQEDEEDDSRDAGQAEVRAILPPLLAVPTL